MIFNKMPNFYIYDQNSPHFNSFLNFFIIKGKEGKKSAEFMNLLRSTFLISRLFNVCTYSRLIYLNIDKRNADSFDVIERFSIFMNNLLI